MKSLSAFSSSFLLRLLQRKCEFDSLVSMPAKIVAKVTPIKIHAVTATKLSLLKVFGINKFLSDSIRPNFELQ